MYKECCTQTGIFLASSTSKEIIGNFMNYAPPPNKQLYFEQVWSLVREIPCGRVATYGQIAKTLPLPDGVDAEEYQLSASRWVGLALAACPDDVPWQRVVNAQGKISHPAAGTQKNLLQGEGVLFSTEKINLSEFQWSGPGQSDLPRQSSLF